MPGYGLGSCKKRKLIEVNDFRRLHTESGHDLRSGLWPTAVFAHAARTPSPAIRLKPILRRPFETEKIHPDTADGACVKTATGHKPDRKL